MKARAEASERLSGEIIASMTSGLLVVDEEGRVRTLESGGAQDARACRRRSGTALSARCWLAPRRWPASSTSACDLGKAIVRRTVPMPRAGRASHLGVTVSPIREEGGSAHGAICLFTDLTEVMELEEQLRLKDSLARLGELTAGIAHEFRNGLATIHGYGRLLELDQLPPEYPSLRRRHQGGDRGARSGRHELPELRQADGAGADASGHAGRLPSAPPTRSATDVTARGGEVIVTGEFGEVEGDEVLLRQAFSNLCSQRARSVRGRARRAESHRRRRARSRARAPCGSP